MSVIMTRGGMIADFRSLFMSRCAAAGVPSTLDQDVENDAVLIDGAPEPVWLAGDRDDDLIHMPLVAASRSASADLVSEGLAELLSPLDAPSRTSRGSRAPQAFPRPYARLRGNRKWSHTAWLITSAGKRWRQ